ATPISCVRCPPITEALSHTSGADYHLHADYSIKSSDQKLCPQLPWLLLCPPFPGHIRLDSSSSSHFHFALRSAAATAPRVIWMQ
ncbi:hypothetical protein JOQ06_003301, partial [Pogonophryne albipinna]